MHNFLFFYLCILEGQKCTFFPKTTLVPGQDLTGKGSANIIIYTGLQDKDVSNKITYR